MPDEPTGPRSSRPADTDADGNWDLAPPSPRRRLPSVRIPEDEVARPVSSAGAGLAESTGVPLAPRDEIPPSVRTPMAPPVRLQTQPDPFETIPTLQRSVVSGDSLSEFLMQPAQMPQSARPERLRYPTLISPFEIDIASAPELAAPGNARPVPQAIPIDAPSVLDLDDVGGEFDETPQQPLAAPPEVAIKAQPGGLTPPPSTHAPGRPVGASAPVRAPAVSSAGPSRGRSRLGVDSLPPQSRPWWELLFQDDYPRFGAPLKPPQIESDVAFIEKRLNLAPGARILDVGCGDGGHAAILAQRGFDVVGIDTSLPLLARASAKARSSQQRVQFQQLDMREMNESAAYDGAVIWDNGFGFFDDATNESVLANLHRALRPRGQILIDLLNRDYVVSRLPSLVWFEGDRSICMDDAQLNEATSRLMVHRTVLFEEGRSREFDYSMRLFSSHELRSMLERVGFRIMEVSGHIATPGAFFGADSPRLIMLAERPAGAE